MKFDVLPAEYIVADLFPAALAIEGMNINDNYRIIITNATVCVFEDHGDTPRMVHEVTYNFIQGSSKSGYTVTTDLNGEWNIRRSAGCGCGTRLRGIHPFAGVPHQFQLRKPLH